MNLEDRVRTVGERTGAPDAPVHAGPQPLEPGADGVVQNHRTPGLEPSFESFERRHRKAVRLDHRYARSPREGTESTTAGHDEELQVLAIAADERSYSMRVVDRLLAEEDMIASFSKYRLLSPGLRPTIERRAHLGCVSPRRVRRDGKRTCGDGRPDPATRESADRC